MVDQCRLGVDWKFTHICNEIFLPCKASHSNILHILHVQAWRWFFMPLHQAMPCHGAWECNHQISSTPHIWVSLKCWVYSQWNSHLIGIMISKTIGFFWVHYTIFRHTPYMGIGLPWFTMVYHWNLAGGRRANVAQRCMHLYGFDGRCCSGRATGEADRGTGKPGATMIQHQNQTQMRTMYGLYYTINSILIYHK